MHLVHHYMKEEHGKFVESELIQYETCYRWSRLNRIEYIIGPVKKKIKKYKFGTFNFEITCATDIVEVKMSNKQMEKE